MTTLEVRIVGINARQPSSVAGKQVSFQMYASEEYVIPAGKSRIVDSGFEIKIPRGFDILIVNGPSVLQKGLWVNCDPNVGEMIPYLDGENPRLSYLVYNASQVEAAIHTGDPLGRFKLIRTAQSASIKEVQSFETDTGSNPVFNDIVEIPKSKDSYFKRIYRNDRDKCIDLFLTNNDGTKILDDLEEFKQSASYLESNNKLLIEAQFVWKQLTEDIKSKVSESFKETRDKMIIKSRSG